MSRNGDAVLCSASRPSRDWDRRGPAAGAIDAHELTGHTRRALTNGIVDAIIHQDAGHEVRSTLRILKAQIDKTPLLAGQEIIRIEIYLNKNLS